MRRRDEVGCPVEEQKLPGTRVLEKKDEGKDEGSLPSLLRSVEKTENEQLRVTYRLVGSSTVRRSTTKQRSGQNRGWVPGDHTMPGVFPPPDA